MLIPSSAANTGAYMSTCKTLTLPQQLEFLKTQLRQERWTVVKDPQPDGATGVLHYTQNGKDSWLRVNITGPRVEMKMINVIPLPVTLTLKPPAGTPEIIDPVEADFPYLAPIPGSKVRGSVSDPEPF